ncbi:hypothetical protein [Bradyrhizobium vignae]|uniref:hypothetical protein n=1 Tax=Bradyrhizobium vignae TaxID=1549949 RepID=UPI00100AFFAB|nr:hypothetical protein EAV90_04555 [Bradyrhizobium vignae]
MFFDRSGPTKDVWYYEHPIPEGRKNYTKTLPLQFEEFKPRFEWWTQPTENERACKVGKCCVVADRVLKEIDAGHMDIVGRGDVAGPAAAMDHIRGRHCEKRIGLRYALHGILRLPFGRRSQIAKAISRLPITQ